MPSSTERSERQGGRLLTALLLWAGVGLAPVAALLLLIGDGDRSLRAAVGLALLSIILVGLALALRPSPVAIKVELEDTIYDEIDILREDTRADITTAARATHRQFGEKLQYLHDMVEHLRGQVEAMRAELARAQHGAPHHAGPAPHVGPAQPGPRAAGAPIVPGGPGVVRHTETVQVTTRSTIVDPHAEEARHGAARGGDWAPRTAQPAGNAEQESWTEQRLRERLAGTGRDHDVDGEVMARRDRDDEDRWSGMRAGDRWASVRSDDRGRELRVGERRAAMHSDESGTEMRIEDRWAAVRRDEPRGRWAGEADWSSRDDDRYQRALPGNNDEPSAADWIRGLRDPEPERRSRYDY